MAPKVIASIRKPIYTGFGMVPGKGEILYHEVSLLGLDGLWRSYSYAKARGNIPVGSVLVYAEDGTVKIATHKDRNWEIAGISCHSYSA